MPQLGAQQQQLPIIQRQHVLRHSRVCASTQSARSPYAHTPNHWLRVPSTAREQRNHEFAHGRQLLDVFVQQRQRQAVGYACDDYNVASLSHNAHANKDANKQTLSYDTPRTDTAIDVRGYNAWYRVRR